MPRVLVVTLFGLAAFVGLPVAASVLIDLYRRDWGVALLLAAFSPIVGMTAWLGSVLWSGRSIPLWVVFGLGGLISSMASGGLLMQGEWLAALGPVSFLLPALPMVWSGLSSTYSKPAKPKGFDDELA